MARNKSFIKLEGTLDGLTFYEKDGENFVKTKSAVSKNRIMNDANYERTRENMQEFGGAAKAGKAFREAFGGMVKLMGDTYLSARISGLMKRINRNGSGTRGERSIDITTNSALLKGFEFNPETPFGSQFTAPFDAPTLDANRDVATWVVPDFDADAYVTAPEGATHFKLVLAYGLVSNYEWEAALESYEPVTEEGNGKGGVAYSSEIPISGLVGSDTTLTVDMGIGAALPATIASIASIGIIFFQEVDGQLYMLASGNGMKVALAE
ncbi:MAG: hypothetical protein CMC14_05700 [Flavobacteriaceae bacterium]|nr:hypothetical protein [Flavobacteriaceae bacterium]|tara:strand:+ start:3075 stop:3875 length:801 start_codon:yes stop_codon:yes gene_type:complete